MKRATRNPRRLALTGACLIGLVLYLGLRLMPAAGAASESQNRPLTDGETAVIAQSAHTATVDLVVDFGDGRVEVARAPFQTGMTGLDLLAASKVEAAVSPDGVPCSIGGIGCPVDDCFCACVHRDDCRFWSYHIGQPNGGWEYAQTGAGGRKLDPGEVNGWAWTRFQPITATANTRAALLGLQWLAGRQDPDGGWGGHVGFTGDAVFAARAAGRGVDRLRTGLSDPRDFLRPNLADYAAEGVAQAGKALAGAVAAGLDPWRSGGDLVAQVWSHYNEDSGRFGSSVWDQAWSILGLAGAGEPIPDAARSILAGDAQASGGWGFIGDAEAADPDSTGLALQAYMAAGGDSGDALVSGALDFLEASQQDEGGWGYDAAAASNVNSSGLVSLGLLAAGQDPDGERWSQRGQSPLAFLASRQALTGRSVYGDEQDDVTDLLATLQSVPAMAGRPLPLAGRKAAIKRAVDWLLAQQNEDGSFANSIGISALAAEALVAADADFRADQGAGYRLLQYLRAEAAQADDSVNLASTTLAAVALGQDPRNFGGRDLVAGILDSYDPDSGEFESVVPHDVFHILALAAADEPIPAKAISTTRESALPTGGWGNNLEGATPIDTGLRLAALAAAGRTRDDYFVWTAHRALRDLQRHDGLFRSPDAITDDMLPTVSSAAIVGLNGGDQSLEDAGWMMGPPGGPFLSPYDGLMATQLPSGAFEAPDMLDFPITATTWAILALSGEALPIRPDGEPEIYLPFLSTRR